MKGMSRLGIVFDKIIDICLIISGVLIIFDALAISTDVLLRYTFGITSAKLFEFTEYTLLWMTFLGTTWLLRHNAHIRMDMIVSRLKPRGQAILNLTAYAISAIVVGVVTFYSIQGLFFDYQLHNIIMRVLMWPKWPVETVIPIGLLLVLAQLLRNLYGNFLSLKGTPTNQQSEGITTREVN